MTYYRRSSPTARERVQIDLVSLGVAAGVAAATFYLVRLLLSREALNPPSPEGHGGAAPPKARLALPEARSGFPEARSAPKRSNDSRTGA